MHALEQEKNKRGGQDSVGHTIELITVGLIRLAELITSIFNESFWSNGSHESESECVGTASIIGDGE